jgi:2-octaprenyl-6-methoxyphenol hydroxylase
MDGNFAIIVAGGGLAGNAAALALAQSGFAVAAVAPAPAREDGRTTALLSSSVDFLKRLGVWESIADEAAPLSTMRIIDATGRLLRAPELSFHASEIGLDAFGYNVANRVLLRELAAACSVTGHVTFIEGSVAGATFGSALQHVTLQDGSQLTANLVVGADGRNSAIRRLSAAGEREWSYPQAALVLEFAHTLPHHDASTEFHTAEGPFTFVPLAPNRCGLVWVQRPEKAQDRMRWRKEELELEIERQMQSMLGKVSIVSEVQSWPLSGLVARSFGGPGWVLAGEAAHVFPPIGAQGFNLGIRDVELIASLAKGLDPSQLAELGPRYHRRRIADVTSRTVSVDLLNRSLLSGFLPIQLARIAGMHAINLMGPLRRLLMREGVSPGGQIREIAQRLRKNA